jgi:TetR/AcrR family transcriptional repressor of mexJK operon
MVVTRAGRPNRDPVAAIDGRLLDTATPLFLDLGYAATSMEAVAAAASVSKRTLYKRHPDKTHPLSAVIAALVTDWLPNFTESLERPILKVALYEAACHMLAVALEPEALALHRLLVAETGHFPELGRAAQEAGTGLGMTCIAALLRRHLSIENPVWAAEQFQALVITGPQQRALGFGVPLDRAEQVIWARRCVALFLSGAVGPAIDACQI